MSESGAATSTAVRDGGVAPSTATVDGDRTVRAWAVWMAGVMVLILVLDAWTEGLASAGRVLLAGSLVFHLVLVPGRRGAVDLGRVALEGLGLAAATLALAEIVRGMTGGTRPALLRVALVVFAAHVVGSLAAGVRGRHPRAFGWLYWPVVLGVGAAAPLAAYLSAEFLGAASWPLDGALLGPVIRLLDAAP